MAKVAAINLESGYYLNGWPFVTLKEISKSENVLFWQVIRPDGTVCLTDNINIWGRKIKKKFKLKEPTIEDGIYETNIKIKVITYPLKIKESETPWIFQSGFSTKPITMARNRIFLTNLIITIIALFILFFVSLYFTQGINRRLKKLVYGTVALAQGDLNYQIKIDSSDELGELATAFNKMTNVLKETSEKLQQQNRILKEQKKELEKINQELDSYSWMVSHDLKEPLRGIEMFAKFVLEDYADKIDETGKDYLMRLSAAAIRMKKLIDDLLTLSQTARIKNPYVSVNSRKLIEEAIKRLKPIIDEKKAKIEIEKEFPTIFCDEIKIEEVFYNLIANGIKYNTQKEPIIKIGTKMDFKKNEMIFYIKDNGIGIKKEYFNLIFQMFQRLYSKNEYGGGTGAGLAIVKKIIEEHKGKIWVESEIDKGSTFFFTISSNL